MEEATNLRFDPRLRKPDKNNAVRFRYGLRLPRRESCSQFGK